MLAVTAKVEAKLQAAKAATEHDAARQLLVKAEAALKLADHVFATCESNCAKIEKAVERHRQLLGSRLVDEGFFQQGHEQWNLASPWLTDALHRKREDLFAAAMGLSRAFIDVAAAKVTHNLGALMGAMQVGAFQDDAKKANLASGPGRQCEHAGAPPSRQPLELSRRPRSSESWG